MEDIIITCANPTCEEKRVFTVKDQEFYSGKGFSTPKYCRTHSAERRAAHNSRDAARSDNQRSGWERPNDREQFGDGYGN